MDSRLPLCRLRARERRLFPRTSLARVCRRAARRGGIPGWRIPGRGRSAGPTPFSSPSRAAPEIPRVRRPRPVCDGHAAAPGVRQGQCGQAPSWLPLTVLTGRHCRSAAPPLRRASGALAAAAVRQEPQPRNGPACTPVASAHCREYRSPFPRSGMQAGFGPDVDCHSGQKHSHENFCIRALYLEPPSRYICLLLHVVYVD